MKKPKQNIESHENRIKDLENEIKTKKQEISKEKQKIRSIPPRIEIIEKEIEKLKLQKILCLNEEYEEDKKKLIISFFNNGLDMNIIQMYNTPDIDLKELQDQLNNHLSLEDKVEIITVSHKKLEVPVETALNVPKEPSVNNPQATSVEQPPFPEDILELCKLKIPEFLEEGLTPNEIKNNFVNVFDQLYKEWFNFFDYYVKTENPDEQQKRKIKEQFRNQKKLIDDVYIPDLMKKVIIIADEMVFEE